MNDYGEKKTGRELTKPRNVTFAYLNRRAQWCLREAMRLDQDRARLLFHAALLHDRLRRRVKQG